MAQETNLNISVTANNNVQFTDNNITIMVNSFSHNDGKHFIVEPQTAKAQFVCAGKQYDFNNTQGILTVEEWYKTELLPKFQMLTLLFSDIEIL